MPAPAVRRLRVVSVFTGAAGLDLGLKRTGAVTVEMCESWAPARRVLADRFPDIEVAENVEHFDPSGSYEVLTAGFPCTDLSHAGGKAGIFGAQSGLVSHVFRIARATEPEWIVLENVPNLLHLHRGLGIRTVVEQLEELGYRWAYRTLDSRFTGVPQRRNRVIVLASRIHDPAAHLLGQDAGEPGGDLESDDRAWGFYWTEGRHGLGLVRGAVPTLKGGSTIGLPSAPAVWVPDAPRGQRIVLPSIEAGEELQGFTSGWTRAALVDGERDPRWKLVGNAVTTGVGEWIGRRLHDQHGQSDSVPVGAPVDRAGRWPAAAWGAPGTVATSALVSKWPELNPVQSLADLVDDSWTPLSYRATKGFLSRIDESSRELGTDFRRDLREHLRAAPRPAVYATSPQGVMRTALWSAGFRFRTDEHAAEGVAHLLDLVHRGTKIAIDVRSCFWHGCPDHVAEHLASNTRWVAKRERVVARDQEMVEALVDRGWFVAVCWAHDDPTAVARTVATLAIQRRDRRGPLHGGTYGHDIALGPTETVDEVETSRSATVTDMTGTRGDQGVPTRSSVLGAGGLVVRRAVGTAS